MSRFKFTALFLATLFLAFLSASLDFQYGDLRYDVGGKTLRHWNLVPSGIVFKPACALVKSGGFPCGSGVSTGGGGTAATSYTLAGPTTGVIAAASSNFSVAANGATTALVTPADASHGGIFTPSTVNLAGVNPVTFTYTPLQAGTYNISTTNGGGLTNPSAIAFTVSNLDSADYPSLTTWGNSDAALTLNGAGDPFGGAHTATLVEDGTFNYHQIFSPTLHPTANATQTISIMVKEGTGTRNLFIDWVENVGFSSGLQAVFNPSTCAFVQDFSYGSAALISTKTQTTGLGSGWCLVQVVGTLGNFTSAALELFTSQGTTNDYQGDGASSLLLYGPVIQ